MKKLASRYCRVKPPPVVRKNEKDDILSISSYRGLTAVSRELFMAKEFCVYIMASKRNGTLYIGVTSDLVKRIWQHKSGEIAGFTKKYDIKILVYYEQHLNAEEAIYREKRLKEWKRAWKIALIERHNPNWCDLYLDIIG